MEHRHRGAGERLWRNFGHDGLLAHDERYGWADEYLDVLYKLWEGSWEDGALLADRGSGVYADPTKIHKIHHVSDRYRVEGPHLVSPSPQRTPLLFQAGSSKAGRDFAARNAEAQFIVSPDPENVRVLIEDTRRLVEQHGRRRSDLKFFQGLSFVVGSTEAEARRKEARVEEQLDLHGMIAQLPVLRERGLARLEYEPGTLRRKLFGHDRLDGRHPAARYRGAFVPSAVTADR